MTPEEVAAVEAAELANALRALEAGKRALTKREAALIDAAKAKAGAVVEPAPALAESTAEIAKRHGCDVRTVQRMQRAATLPGVPPVPWDRWPELRAWYRAHYTSDPAKPATGSARVPDWLKESAPDLPAAPAAVVEDHGAVDVLGDMRRIVAQKRARWLAAPGNEAVEVDYFAALNEFTAAEKRFLASGGSGYVSAAKVEAFIATVHARLPRRLEADLCAMFPEVRRAVAGPEPEAAYRALISGLCAAIGRRLCESKFSELP